MRGMGWEMGTGGESKVCTSIHWSRKVATACVLMEVQSVLVKPRKLLEAVLHEV